VGDSLFFLHGLWCAALSPPPFTSHSEPSGGGHKRKKPGNPKKTLFWWLSGGVGAPSLPPYWFQVGGMGLPTTGGKKHHQAMAEVLGFSLVFQALENPLGKASTQTIKHIFRAARDLAGGAPLFSPPRPPACLFLALKNGWGGFCPGGGAMGGPTGQKLNRSFLHKGFSSLDLCPDRPNHLANQGGPQTQPYCSFLLGQRQFKNPKQQKTNGAGFATIILFGGGKPHNNIPTTKIAPPPPHALHKRGRRG